MDVGAAGPAERRLGRRAVLAVLLGAAGAALAGCADGSTASSSAPAEPAAEVPTTHVPPPLPGSGPAAAPEPLPRVVRHVGQLHPHAASSAVALTIDDGPDPANTPRVLELLAALGITASFCVIGEQVADHRDLVRRTAAAGHTIVNHTQTHPLHVRGMTAAQLDDEIGGPQRALGDLLGTAPTLFRAPGGEWTDEVLAATERAGLAPLGWSVDPRDWSKPGVATIESSLLLAVAGDVLLCHDGGGDRSETVEALAQVLPQLTAAGRTFIPL